jgi:inosine-uridine nucleoside N-ribohydrolase
MPTKIILDTDIGSDIDDAVCLAYLLAQPECELLGITTVSGEPEKRAMIASAQCKVAGRDIPIFPGTGDPLLVAQQQPQAPQAAALTNWAHDTDFPQGEAIEFLRRTIRANPGEIVLLTIGPLTNIALLFKTDPKIPRLLKSIVLMCGVFTESAQQSGAWHGPLEWNALLDPHAARIVYDTPVRLHRSFGLDVTRQVYMDAPAVRQKFQVDYLKPVLDFAEVWFKKRDIITFHDPLAAAAIFDESICGYQSGQVSVEVTDPQLLGLTRWRPGPANAPHQIAVEVAAERFFEHYFTMFDS